MTTLDDGRGAIAHEAGQPVVRIVAGTPVPYVGTVYDADDEVIGYCNTLNGVAIAGTFTVDPDAACALTQVQKIARLRSE